VNDTAGNPIKDPSGNPGFPGFDNMSAAASLGYTAQMQESGVPVTFTYVSDAHDNHHDPSGSNVAYGPGEAGYEQQLADYNKAFTTFFGRLASDGIDKTNTLFVFTADEGDHFAGSIPSGCDGVTTPCTYTHAFWTPGSSFPANQIGEVNANIKALIANPASLGYDIHFDSAPTFYVNNQPSRTNPDLRQFERNTAAATAIDPYVDPVNPAPIADHLIDTVGEKALHMVNADPLRTPTFTMFANPDYFFETFTPACGATVCVDYHFAWSHGDDSPEIGRTWLGMVGPGVIHSSAIGHTWSDHTDIQPTMLSLVGLHDDYVPDGRMLPLVRAGARPAGVQGDPSSFNTTAVWYKRITAPFDTFGQSVLSADTAALSSGSATSDRTYRCISTTLGSLTTDRDAVAADMRQALNDAEFNGVSIPDDDAASYERQAKSILARAAHLANNC